MSETDDLEIIERYILLLLGAKERPIPSMLHIQKEMFMLSKVNPKIKNFLNFERHYKGPYSQVLKELVEEPFYHSDDFLFNGKNISITGKGKSEFEDFLRKYGIDENFSKFLKSMELIRELYDKLTEDELLFLIYTRYPEYTELSSVSDRLLQNRKKKEELAKSLLERHVITKKRYEELINDDG